LVKQFSKLDLLCRLRSFFGHCSSWCLFQNHLAC
jgi:hypothetical protein